MYKCGAGTCHVAASPRPMVERHLTPKSEIVPPKKLQSVQSSSFIPSWVDWNSSSHEIWICVAKFHCKPPSWTPHLDHPMFATLVRTGPGSQISISSGCLHVGVSKPCASWFARVFCIQLIEIRVSPASVVTSAAASGKATSSKTFIPPQSKRVVLSTRSFYEYVCACLKRKTL